MKDNTKQQNKVELSMFAEILADYIREWQENGKDPLENPQELENDATELVGVAIDPIPCWQKTAEPLDDGLYQTPIGLALVRKNRYVMVHDLEERLPRLGDIPMAEWHNKREAIEILDKETDIAWFGNLFTHLRKTGQLDGLCKCEGHRWYYDTNGIIEKYKRGELNYHPKH